MSWFADENFWQLFYAWMFPADSFLAAQQQADDIIHLSGIDSGQVLDLCCGPGRHSIAMAQRSFVVTGVDLQPYLLQKARDYAQAEDVAVEFIEDDMRSFRRPDYFDLVISMFSSFGYFDDAADDLKVLENTYSSLKSGGCLLLDVRGKEIHAMAKISSDASTMPNGDRILQYSRVDAGWGSTTNEWIYLQGNSAQSFSVRYNLYSAVELSNMLRQTGFTQVQVFGSLSGTAYDLDAKRLVIVAKK